MNNTNSNTGSRCTKAYPYASLHLFLHMFFCGYCRRTNTQLNDYLKQLGQTAPFQSSRTDESIFDKAVSVYTTANPKPMSEWVWNLSGLLIIGCSVLFSFSAHYEYMKTFVGPLFQIVLSLLFGLLISIFVSVYALSHYKKMSRLRDYVNSLRNIHI